MSELVDFAKRLREQLMAANREPHWDADEAERYMAGIGIRREKFVQSAIRLTDIVIRPRVKTLADCFANATLAKDEPAGNCSCWFGYCERLPACTRVSFKVEHDIRFENVTVCFEASMMPMFIKLNERDKLTCSLDEVKHEAVANWVEARLLEFLDSYLRIDRGGDDFDDDTATDPVCGMRISRRLAVGSETYRGHPYWFCSKECQERFARVPTAYVEVKAT